MKLLHSGKIRDIYADGDDILLVASDRISIYDVVLPTEIPDKGRILTALSLWWFAQLEDIVPNHIISSGVSAEFAGRAVRCKRLAMVPIECVARGYLTGSGLRDYTRTGTVSGIRLPEGLQEASRLHEPIFTPSSKASLGEHDEPMTFDEVAGKVGAAVAEQLRDLTLAVYRRGCEIAQQRGIIVADTKLEFGWDADGVLTLADEVLTPDSSRFWPADRWRPGQVQPSFDKQFVRDWAVATGWDKQPPGPLMPADVVEATRARYIEAYERITGIAWE